MTVVRNGVDASRKLGSTESVESNEHSKVMSNFVSLFRKIIDRSYAMCTQLVLSDPMCVDNIQQVQNLVINTSVAYATNTIDCH